MFPRKIGRLKPVWATEQVPGQHRLHSENWFLVSQVTHGGRALTRGLKPSEVRERAALLVSALETLRFAP